MQFIKILSLDELDGLKILVCSNGEIFTLPKMKTRSNGRKDNRSGVKLRPTKDRYGYYRITLSYNNKRKSHYIHRLVARAYLKNYSEQLQVNHKDGIKTNNDIKNLEMVTLQENIRHSIETGLKPKMIRDKSGKFLRKGVI